MIRRVGMTLSLVPGILREYIDTINYRYIYIYTYLPYVDRFFARKKNHLSLIRAQVEVENAESKMRELGFPRRPGRREQTPNFGRFLEN